MSGVPRDCWLHGESPRRAGAKALGNSEYHAVLIFAQKLEVWRACLSGVHEEELKREGVI